VKAPAPVPDGGRFAILQDPQGAVFAVYTFSQTQGGDAPSADIPLGHSSWHELATTDHAAAFSLSAAVRLAHHQRDGHGAAGRLSDIRPGRREGSVWRDVLKAPGSPGGPNWLPYLKVADARPATATAKKNGAQILSGPMQVPGGGWISMGIDPQGAAFAIHSVAQAAPTKKRRPVKTKSRLEAKQGHESHEEKGREERRHCVARSEAGSKK
jgi:predicted enzyme related to lactoylglutathione lyase